MNIVAIGRTKNLYNAILDFVKNGHSIAAIITSKAAPEYSVNEHNFCELAKKLNCHFYDLSLNHNSLDNVLSNIKSADIGISVNWTRIITKKILTHFQIGILNAHFGDLPDYRGNACPNWAIISGDKKLVLSVHLMEGEQLDCGRVICQDTYFLGEMDSIGDVYEWSEKVIPKLFVDAVNRLNDDPEYCLKYAPCDGSKGFRCYPRTPDDSFINWSSSAVDIDRLVKASSHPFRGAYTYFIECGLLKRLYIHKSRVFSVKTSDLGVPGRILLNDKSTGCTHVMCKDGILEILQCQIDDGDIFAPGTYFRSIRTKFGVRIEDYMWEKMRENTNPK